MNAISEILTHTPIWVYLVLAYGLFVGIQSLGERSRSVRTLFILPLVFLGLSISSLVTGFSAVPIGGLFWAAALLLGLALGWLLLSAKVLDLDVKAGKLRVAGSPVTLVVFLIVFGTKYSYGVAVGMSPGLGSDAAFVSTVLSLSGLSTGLVVGRVAKMLIDFSSLSSANRKVEPV